MNPLGTNPINMIRTFFNPLNQFFSLILVGLVIFNIHLNDIIFFVRGVNMLKICKSITMNIETASKVNELVDKGIIKNFSSGVQESLDSFLVEYE